MRQDNIGNMLPYEAMGLRDVEKQFHYVADKFRDTETLMKYVSEEYGNHVFTISDTPLGELTCQIIVFKDSQSDDYGIRIIYNMANTEKVAGTYYFDIKDQGELNYIASELS